MAEACPLIQMSPCVCSRRKPRRDTQDGATTHHTPGARARASCVHAFVVAAFGAQWNRLGLPS
eukprot:11990899-Alexandrium_andersonii.AAC.1